MKSPHISTARMRSPLIVLSVFAPACLVFVILFRLHALPAQAALQPEGPAAAAQSPAGTIIASNITTNTTWTLAGSPYSLTKVINVAAGVSLTVEQGVSVTAGQYGGLNVYGNLIARGSPASPVLFTGATRTPGSWYGIELSGYAGLTPTISLQNAVVEYGGNMLYANVTIRSAWASIDQSTFRFSGGYGLLSDLDSQVQIANSSMLSNTNSAVRFEGYSSAPYDPVLSNLTASGNALNAVEYYASNLEGNHTWEAMGLPYVAAGGMQVSEGASLTINPGVQVQVDTGFYVYGNLQAVGTPANPITFTGILTRTSGPPNSWWGMTIAKAGTVTPTANLQYVTMEYGGSSGSADSGNLVLGDANVTLTNSTIRNGPANGVVVADALNLATIADTQFTGNGRYPLYVTGMGDPVLRNLSASGNVTNAIGLGGPWFAYGGDYIWEAAGLPYVADGNLTVSSNASLTIEPGVELRMGQGAGLNIAGSLTAAGTAARPITITGASPAPGTWSTLSVNGRAVLDYCDIGYGGASNVFGPTPMISIGAEALVQRCRVHDSAGAGIQVQGSLDVRPFIRQNRIENNGFGLRNSIGGATPPNVDARFNWWGDPSGPYNSATNPTGKGNAVSALVLFAPWLTSPQQSPTGLNIDLVGPTKFVPGGVEEYAVRYSNDLTQTVQNAVVVVALPKYASYEDDSGGGIQWPEPHQIFWKVGSLAPGQTGLLSVRVRFDWGIPYGTHDTAVALISGSNLASPAFDVSGYLAYVPQVVINEEALAASDVTAERNAYPELNQLYQQAIQAGYQFGAASRFTLSTGVQVTHTVLLKFQPDFGAVDLSRSGTRAYALVMSSDSLVLQTTAGAVSYDVQTGSWQNATPPLASLSPSQAAVSWSDCMQNCIIDLVPGYVAKNVFKSVSVVKKGINCYKAATGDELAMANCANIVTKIPGIGEGIDLGKCNSDCQNDPDSHWCTEDKRYCNGDSFWDFLSIEVITHVRCNQDTHRYFAPETETICAVCEKCVETNGRPWCTSKLGASTLRLSPDFGAASPYGSLAPADTTVRQCSECAAAKDPNAKYGPEGDVVPGQVVTYTVTYENVGAGDAYGVFVEDALSDAFDLSTLTLYGGGELVAPNRTVYWFVDHLSPKGQPGSSGAVTLTARLKSNLPSGTVVANQAVVHFPSVPEDTPTNSVVNVVRPLVALPQMLQATAGVPLAIHLQGRDAAGSPLVYSVVEPPLYGTLSGAAPNLSYQTGPTAAGVDHLRFTVSNGVTTSPPAEVGITVLPSPNDTTPPTVLRTVPTNGAALPTLDPTPFFTDTLGPLYRPAIFAEFSKPISVTTLTTATVRLVEPGGRQVPIALNYDASTERLTILPREQLNQGVLYAVSITHGITDLRGNAMAADYTWSFTIGGAQKRYLYLPAIVR